MKAEEFRLLERIEQDHWWFVGKRHLLAALLAGDAGGKRLLDLGCGTGGVLRHLQRRFECVGADRSPLALRVCSEKGFTRLVRADAAASPFAAGIFDWVLALDVIEHLDDDVGFLRGAAELVGPGGRLVIGVPAFQLLWSQQDEVLEHRRRYTARSLERAVRAAGLEPERTTYTNFFVFPPALVWRLLSHRLGLGRFAPRTDFWTLPRALNALLAGLYRVEAWLLARLDLPVGVSAVCIARKPAPSAPASGGPPDRMPS